jgi:hypothetical protein
MLRHGHEYAETIVARTGWTIAEHWAMSWLVPLCLHTLDAVRRLRSFASGYLPHEHNAEERWARKMDTLNAELEADRYD